jgi:aldehyde dehydrogenase (NAD+)
MNAMTKGARMDYDSLYIAGKFVPAMQGTEPAITPIDGSVIGHAPVGSPAEARAALDAAHASFEGGLWANAERRVRSAGMQQLLDMVLARKDEIVRLMMLEMGYTRMEGEGQLQLGTDQMAKFVELSAADPVKTLPLVSTPWHDGTTKLGGAITTRDPIGTVVAITPYNAGFLLGLMKLGPALAAGNSVVLKPAPYTPLQTLLLMDMVAELDLPPGVVNMVTGGADVGEALCSDPRVDMISFTGSDKVGAAIMAQAAPHITKCHLELGGKSALILRRDADIAKALPGVLFSNFAQAGQGCACTTRILVDNAIRGDLVAALGEAMKHWKVGDPFEQGVVTGPLIREVARERAEMFVERAQVEGATLVAGGKRPEGLDARLSGGFYFEPTIFDGVSNDSYLGQNEVFGPIMAIIGFNSDEEAVAIANKSEFGLGGSIVSADAGKAMDMAMKIRTGSIAINGGSGRLHPDTPFGGYKRSGLGREWGEEGYNEYTQIKAITFPVGQ